MSTQKTLPGMTRDHLFDLHIEFTRTPQQAHVATILLAGAGVKFEGLGSSPRGALVNLASKLQDDGIDVYALLTRDPSMSSCPNTPTAAPAVKIDPNAPKQLPMDLINTPHPDCQVECSSFANFNDARCKSMCGHRRLQ